jgi:O-antigen/teichoic acid export membrane protein
MLVSALNTAFSPWLAEKLNNKNYDEIRKFTKIYIVFFVTIAIGIVLIAPEILMILGGKSYMEAKYVIPPVAMGCIVQFMYIFYVDIEQFKKQTIGMAIASVIAALVNYILNFILIPKYGYLVAAYTTLVGYIILLAIHMYLVLRLGYKNVYSNIFIISTISVTGIIAALVMLSYSNNPIRYICIALYIAIILIGIKKYNEQFKRMLKLIIKI